MSNRHCGLACLLPLAVGALLPAIVAGGETAAKRWTPAPISSDQYESTPTFTPDGAEMFFMLSDRRFERYRIMHSRCKGYAWSSPEPAPFAASSPAVDADPFITANGKRLYFVSSRHEPGGDDLDIWYVERQANGTWSAARRLPEPVNSKGAELLPRVDASGRIYFGSDRNGGFGLSDIYVASPAENGAWSVRNLGTPVSTAANEYEADISQDGQTLILVADRGDRSHLYRFLLDGGVWLEKGRISARPDVFQVGPLLSPTADRLLFAQADAERSGEIFLIDLTSSPVADWPPHCGSARR